MSDPLAIAAAARESIVELSRDPLAMMLLENSQLTLTQLETLLAESISNENLIKKAQRRGFRPSKRKITRGSYNRTLIQAQKNVIRSIYTVLLLGYVRLFDTAALQPFLELSDTIQSYIQEVRNSSPEDHQIIDELNRRLLEGLSALASRRSFKEAF